MTKAKKGPDPKSGFLPAALRPRDKMTHILRCERCDTLAQDNTKTPIFWGFFYWHGSCYSLCDMNTLNIRSLDRLMNDMLTDCYSTRYAHYGSFEETDDSYTLHAQVPGVSKEDLRIEFEEDVLSIKGENKKYKYFKE